MIWAYEIRPVESVRNESKKGEDSREKERRVLEYKILKELNSLAKFNENKAKFQDEFEKAKDEYIKAKENLSRVSRTYDNFLANRIVDNSELLNDLDVYFENYKEYSDAIKKAYSKAVKNA